ncbi:hypothetical protein [Caballeronia sp. J97]|uniref:hypothetical protein n=1 Tax=Caballeronia sp. J97 TaxID=2805429 RepID=UPI002AAFE887|nr:hypothetical protein [Caballeronia sp. J97]
MKHETDAKNAVRQANDECNHAQSGRIGGFGKALSSHDRNWAWTTSGSAYDWMDSHAPFAHLD